jgi:hypothetical protein
MKHSRMQATQLQYSESGEYQLEVEIKASLYIPTVEGSVLLLAKLQ